MLRQVVMKSIKDAFRTTPVTAIVPNRRRDLGIKAGCPIHFDRFQDQKLVTQLVTRFENFGFYEKTRDDGEEWTITNEIKRFAMVSKGKQKQLKTAKIGLLIVSR